MAVNIEKMRADMLTSQKLLAWETRKFVISIVVGAAALLGAGVALGNYFTNLHNPPAASGPQTPKL